MLAEIFTFDHKKRETFKSEDCITKGTRIIIAAELEEMQASIQKEEEINKTKIQEVRETSAKYEEISSSIKEIRSKEELFGIIEQLKKNGLYDDSHPYFVEDSPFYLSTTDEEYLEVPREDPISGEGLSFYEIN